MQPGSSPKVFMLTTFNLCDNNGYTSTRINNFFTQNGFEMLSSPDQADYIVISTCGFDQERENIAIQCINRYVEQFSKEKQVIICGCLTKINQSVLDIPKVIAIGPKELHKFNDVFKPDVKIENVSGGILNDRFIDRNYGFFDTYYLQICQGCINNCSYCAIKTAKGFVTSRHPAELIAELEQAVDGGYKRFMLIADDCGSYGVDLGIDLTDFLNQLIKYDVSFKINYFEPREFLQLYPKIDERILANIEFINIPIQSTSNRVIRMMNRSYDVDAVINAVKEIKARFPRTFVETHIIYGFPTETRQEFEDTFNAADYFDSVIYFYYTDRKNVRSASFEGKISNSEMIRRTEAILAHPRFCLKQGEAEPPVVLLGYDLREPEDIYKSLAQSCHRECLGSEFLAAPLDS